MGGTGGAIKCALDSTEEARSCQCVPHYASVSVFVLCHVYCAMCLYCAMCHVFVLCHVYYVMSVTLCHVFYMAIVPCAMFALYLASNHLEYPHSFSTVCPRLNVNQTGITGERHNDAIILLDTVVQAVTLAEC